jgi:hypothetical protein
MNIPYDIPEIYCGHCSNVIEGGPKSIPECCDNDICETCMDESINAAVSA